MRYGLGGRLDAVLAAPLRRVHGRIGRREELRGGRRGGRRRDAEARRYRDRCPMDREDDPTGEGKADPLGDVDSTVEIRPRQDEEELLPAPAAGKVDVADV